MSNNSIYAAFERMWGHVKAELNDKSNTDHSHTAEEIVGGRFSSIMYAGINQQSPAVSLIRNSKLVTSDTTPTYNGEICWTYK